MSEIYNGIIYTTSNPSTVTGFNTNSATGLSVIQANATIMSFNSNGYPVTSITNFAFVNCTIITNITIPSSITAIPTGCFFGCSNLTAVTLQGTVTTIGSYAFYNNKINNISVPNVTNLGSNAFSTCTELTAITLPSTGLSVIPENCFINCSSLATVELGNITSIEINAFNGAGLTSMSIPSGVVSLPYGCFFNCTQLTSISLNNVTDIGENTFRQCTSLPSITLPTNLITINASAFRQCTSLLSINISSGVQVIPTNCFNGCSALTTVDMPSNLTTINTDAFASCSSLATMTFNNATSGYTVNSPIFTQITRNGIRQFIFTVETARHDINTTLRNQIAGTIETQSQIVLPNAPVPTRAHWITYKINPTTYSKRIV